jgi:succinate dehydrogenase / fumarate reductase flavoprotein subunit
MGGLWVDYNLMTTLPGLHVLGEANFSDHGANRLGASAPHAGTGRRLFHHSLHDRAITLANTKLDKVTADRPEFQAARSAVAETANRC